MGDHEELTAALPDGYEAYGRYWPVGAPRGGVLFLHGIQSHAGWYEHSARRLQQAGFAVMQPDRRGSGRNQRDRGHAESREQLIADAWCWAEQLRERAGFRQVHLVGVSWGGRLACAMASRDEENIESLTLVCPGLFPRVDLSGLEKFRVGFSMLGDRRRMFDIPLNDAELFTSQPEWLAFIRSDSLALRRVSAAFLLATRKMDAALHELRRRPPIPLHLLTAGNDGIIDTERTIGYVHSLSWPRLQITQYPHARHTLEFEPIGEAYRATVVEWLGAL